MDFGSKVKESGGGNVWAGFSQEGNGRSSFRVGRPCFWALGFSLKTEDWQKAKTHKILDSGGKGERTCTRREICRFSLGTHCGGFKIMIKPSIPTEMGPVIQGLREDDSAIHFMENQSWAIFALRPWKPSGR